MKKHIAIAVAALLFAAVPAHAEDATPAAGAGAVPAADAAAEPAAAPPPPPQEEVRAMTPEARLLQEEKEAAKAPAPGAPTEPAAIIELKEKAEAGDVEAMKALGDMYANGSADTLVDREEAIKWYIMAAQQADDEAQVYVGDAYDKGRGVPQSSIEAARWYEMAAQQGNAVAMGELGHLYALGRGVEKDHTKAYFWLTLADRFGFKDYSDLIPKSAANVNRVEKRRMDKALPYWKPTEGKKVGKSLKADEFDLGN